LNLISDAVVSEKGSKFVYSPTLPYFPGIPLFFIDPALFSLAVD